MYEKYKTGQMYQPHIKVQEDNSQPDSEPLIYRRHLEKKTKKENKNSFKFNLAENTFAYHSRENESSEASKGMLFPHEFQKKAAQKEDSIASISLASEKSFHAINKNEAAPADLKILKQESRNKFALSKTVPSKSKVIKTEGLVPEKVSKVEKIFPKIIDSNAEVSHTQPPQKTKPEESTIISQKLSTSVPTKVTIDKFQGEQKIPASLSCSNFNAYQRIVNRNKAKKHKNRVSRLPSKEKLTGVANSIKFSFQLNKTNPHSRTQNDGLLKFERINAKSSTNRSQFKQKSSQQTVCLSTKEVKKIIPSINFFEEYESLQKSSLSKRNTKNDYSTIINENKQKVEQTEEVLPQIKKNKKITSTKVTSQLKSITNRRISNSIIEEKDENNNDAIVSQRLAHDANSKTVSTKLTNFRKNPVSKESIIGVSQVEPTIENQGEDVSLLTSRELENDTQFYMKLNAQNHLTTLNEKTTKPQLVENLGPTLPYLQAYVSKTANLQGMVRGIYPHAKAGEFLLHVYILDSTLYVPRDKEGEFIRVLFGNGPYG